MLLNRSIQEQQNCTLSKMTHPLTMIIFYTLAVFLLSLPTLIKIPAVGRLGYTIMPQGGRWREGQVSLTVFTVLVPVCRT